MTDHRIDPDLLRAAEGMLSLLNPGEYGVADDDPKTKLILDLADVVARLSTPPIVIDGIAVLIHGYARQTADVDLLVARQDAMSLVRALELDGRFRKESLERWRHVGTGAGLDLCVEGERTHPGRQERFPAPSAVASIPKHPIAVVALNDLLALKAKSGRAKDWADFVCLAKIHHLDESLRTAVRSRLIDPEVIRLAEQWWQEAREEADRERNVRPSWGDEG